MQGIWTEKLIELRPYDEKGCDDMSYSLNSLKGRFIGDNVEIPFSGLLRGH